jgi:hypothetical protein
MDQGCEIVPFSSVWVQHTSSLLPVIEHRPGLDQLAITYFNELIFHLSIFVINHHLASSFLPLANTVQWQETQPSRNYGVAASQGRQIHCDFAFVSRRARY